MAPADFSNVGAITFEIAKDPNPNYNIFGLDYQFEVLGTIGPTFLHTDLPYLVTSGLDVVKKTNGTDNNSPTGPYVPVGDTVTWTYEVTNTGNESIANVTVKDDAGTPSNAADDFSASYVSGDTNNNNLLDPGETWLYRATGTAVAGQYANKATASGTGKVSELPVSDTDKDHYFGMKSEIHIEKSTNGHDADAAPGPFVPIGSPVTWTYAVTNPGNVPLSNVEITDDAGTSVDTNDDFNPTYVSGDTNNNNLLDPGETWIYKATATAIGGQYGNVATVTGVDPLEETVEDSDPSHYYGVEKLVNIEKLTNGQDADSPTGPLVYVGDTVTWTYVVTNPGNSPVSNVVVTDDNGTPGDPGDDFHPTFIGGDTNSDGKLDPGETWTYEAYGTAIAGQYANWATVTGKGPAGEDQVDTDPSHYYGANPAIHIEKATNGQDADTPTGPLVPVGSTVTWTYVLTNPGNVPLSNVVVKDDNGTPANPGDDITPTLISGDTNSDGKLDPGETWTYRATGTARAGQYANLATVTGEPPVCPASSGTPVVVPCTVSDTDPSHYFGFEAGIHIEKATNGQDADTPIGPLVAAGSTVTWTYTVTNTGTAPLSNVVVRDDNGTPSNPNDDFAPLFSGGDTNGNSLLDPGETWIYHATGTAVVGQHGNVGKVTAKDPAGNPIEDTDPSHYFGVKAVIHVEKATNGQDADTPTGPVVPVGSTVIWTYEVTNPGNVPLVNVVLKDDNGTPANTNDDFTPTFTGGDTNADGKLDLGETWTYRATGTALAGQYGNLATVTGIDPLQRPVEDTDPSHYLGGEPAIHIEKATNGQDADTPTGPLVQVGSTVTWTYVVTNPGNVPLSNVVVTDDNGTPSITGDDFSPTRISGDVNNNNKLDPGETWTYQATGTAIAGQYANLSKVTGRDPLNTQVTDDDPSHYFGINSAIHIEKATNGQDADNPTGPLVAAGSTVTWTYVVTNPGNVPLSGVVVKDDNGTPASTGDDFNPTFTGGDTNGDGKLDPGETWTYQATGTAIAGQYANVAKVTGKDPGNRQVTDDDPSHYFGVTSGIHIEKATNGEDADTPTGPLVQAGGTVTWTYVVTNTGNSPLSNVVVKDNNGTPLNPGDDFSPVRISGDVNNNNKLDPGETWTYQATGTAILGQYANLATATATDPINRPVSDDDPSHYFGFDAQIHIEKATNGHDADTPTGPLVPAGSTVTWTYVVTNSGNVPLANVQVKDDNGTPLNPADDFTPTFVGGDTNNDGLLNPTETWTYQATGTAIAGQYANLATVTGTDPINRQVTDGDPSHYFGVNAVIHIEKATNGQDADNPTGPLVASGGTVTWTYVVTNPGNVPLSGVVVKDDNGTPANTGDDFSPTFVGGDTNNDGKLDPTETWTYQATGTAIAGQYANSATVTGKDPLNQQVSDTDPSHYFGVTSGIHIEKATNGQDADSPTGPLVPAGSTVTWTYLVTNTGNSPLSNVVVKDNNGTSANPGDDFNPVRISGDVNNNNKLDPGETWTYQATGTAILGQYANLATATATDPINRPVNDDDPSHYFGFDAQIHIEKATNGQDADTPTGPLVPAGSTVTWTYVVTNPGNVPLANVQVKDDNGTPLNPADDFTPTFVGGDANSNGKLDPGEIWTYQATKSAQVGQYENLAKVTGLDPLEQPHSDTDPSHYFGVDARVNIEKLTNGQDADTPTGPQVATGSTVTWTYVVTNPGNVPLSGVVVTDDAGTPANPGDDFNPSLISGDANNNGKLDPGETWTYRATGTAIEGQYGNLAKVTGTDPLNRQVVDDDPSHYLGINDPAIHIEKATNGQDADSPTGPLVPVGSTVTWTYVVTNKGNVPLSNVVVRDDSGTPANTGDDFSPTFISGDTNNNGKLDLTETWTYRATGIAVAGQYGNLATVTGVDPTGQTRTDTDPSHYFGVNSAIHVEKATNGQDADTPTGPLVPAGSTVTWTYAVTNPGNVALSNVVVKDDNGTPANPGDDFTPMFINGDTNNNGKLDPGETWLYRATGTAVAGQYANLATATGVDPLQQTRTDTDPSHYFGANSTIHIEKATNGQDADNPTGPLVAAGSTVTWTYAVTNPGNVPLSGVVVKDDNGTPLNPTDDFNPPFIGGDTNSNNMLDPGETWTYRATGTALAGQYANQSYVVGIDPLGGTATDADPSHYFGVTSGIHIEKATNGQDADTPTGPLVPAGSTVTWTYVVTNTGNSPLSNVVVKDNNGTPANTGDDFSPTFVSGDTNGDGKLDPNETWTYQATGTAIAGQYANLATVTGVDPINRQVTDDDPSHYFGVTSGIHIEKATNGQDADNPTGPLVASGSTVTWTYVVTNLGNVPLSNVVVKDDHGTPANTDDDFNPTLISGDANNDGKLDPGETWTYLATGTAIAGQYANLATVTGTDPINRQVADDDPSHYFGVDSAIHIEKATNGQDADNPTGPLVPTGSTVTWTYVVTNPGNVPLSGVQVKDDHGTPANTGDDFSPTYISGDVNGNGLLEPDETWTYRATGTAAAGQYANLATVTGIDPINRQVTDDDPSHYFGVTSGIHIEKATNGQDADNPTGPLVPAGSTVTWTYVVTNTGNVPLSNVQVTDNNGTPANTGDDFNPVRISGDANSNNMLDPGETWTYQATGTAIAGQYANLATVTGLDPIDRRVNDDDPSHYFGVDSAVHIEKATNGHDADNPTGPLVPAGSTVTWTYVVTNPGNVALSNVVVKDNHGTPANTGDDFSPTYVSGDTNNDGKLDPSETWTYRATGTAIAGQYGNLATVTGIDPINRSVSDDDPSHYFGVDSRVNIEKLTNGEDVDAPTGPVVAPGSTVTWTYEVTNPGNVPLSNVVVTDDAGTPANPGDDFHPTLISGDTNSNGLLDPGETWTYQATGTAIVGQYVNRATVTGRDPLGSEVEVEDEDPSYYLGKRRIVVLGPDKNPGTPQYVKVVDVDTEEILRQFVAYESTYNGGTRVALVDLDGDGQEEIITAPGRNRTPEVRIFSLDGDPVAGFPSFLGQNASFAGGIQLAVADVNGDGKPDIITVPSYGDSEVRVFLNQYPASPAFSSTPDMTFQAFPTAIVGGAVVSAGDMGSTVGGSFVNTPDGKAEIVVATGGGARATVSVFDVSSGTPARVQTFFPFTAVNSNFLGGVSLDVARIDGDAIPDIVTGMGLNGTSRIEVWHWNTSVANVEVLGAIPNAFTGSSTNAPVNVAAMDTDGDDIADAVFAVQGPIGTIGEIHRFNIINTAPFQYVAASPLTGFLGPWFIATAKNASSSIPVPPPLPSIPVNNKWTNPINPLDVTARGYVSPLDALATINFINSRPGITTLPTVQTNPPRYYDTNVDGQVTPSDVVMIVNYLNAESPRDGEGEASGATGSVSAAAFRWVEPARLTDGGKASVIVEGTAEPAPVVPAIVYAHADALREPSAEPQPQRFSIEAASPLDDVDPLGLESVLDSIAEAIARSGW